MEKKAVTMLRPSICVTKFEIDFQLITYVLQRFHDSFTYSFG
ncbi:MAG: hypothetical protein K0S24_1686 [Sphingobacterium sp.]|jgi:hypothetical protein|nr:hypothetical protein [Sphingobacterium sp.]